MQWLRREVAGRTTSPILPGALTFINRQLTLLTRCLPGAAIPKREVSSQVPTIGGISRGLLRRRKPLFYDLVAELPICGVDNGFSAGIYQRSQGYLYSRFGMTGSSHNFGI